MTGKGRWLSFIAGTVVGMTVLIAILFGVIYFGSNRTWLLRVNTNGIGEKVQGAAQIMAVEMLPDYFEEVKASVPAMVTAQVKDQFGDIKFQLGGEEFSLPAEFVQRLEENYRVSLITSISEILDAISLEEMSTELGQEIVEIVENSLYAEFNTRTVDIKILRDLISVPLHIELVNQPGGGPLKLELYAEEAFTGF